MATGAEKRSPMTDRIQSQKSLGCSASRSGYRMNANEPKKAMNGKMMV